MHLMQITRFWQGALQSVVSTRTKPLSLPHRPCPYLRAGSLPAGVSATLSRMALTQSTLPCSAAWCSAVPWPLLPVAQGFAPCSQHAQVSLRLRVRPGASARNQQMSM